MATTARIDPIRNFKFNVQASLPGETDPFAKFGFMSVEGIAMNTEMVAYREGGYNTSPHKLPGQTDFSPLTMSAGVFYNQAHVRRQLGLGHALDDRSG
jgi:phage tail-like protein